MKLVTLLLAASAAFAHGEGKPGPHGGEIRMPGAFHTEVVAIDKKTLKVYLLDLQWKNPTTKDSSVEVVTSGKRIKCEKGSDNFICKPVDLETKGKIEVHATREKQKGAAAEYEAPFKVSSPST